MDWLSLNHFADMTGNGNVGVTLSNLDCSFFPLGNSAINNLDTATHIETDLTNAAYSGNVLTTALAGRQIKTYRLSPGSTPPPPTTVTLAPVADAYVRDGVNYSNLNFGASASLIVKKDATSFNRIAYFKFDITTAPATITNAKLRVYGNHTTTGGGTSTEFAYPVSDVSWVESAIKWNNRPALGTAISPGVTLNKTLQ